MKRGLLIVLSGPSGVGKGTVRKKVFKDLSLNLAYSISMTTRSPREKEVDGKDYFFIQKPQFLQKIEEQGFLEYSEHFENFYGTPKDFVLETLKDKDVLLEIDVNGGLEIKKSYPDAVLIMITPPSIQEIRNRLINRHTESEEKINLRMQRIEYELDKQNLYDYSVVNDKLEQAIIDIENIIKSEKIK